MAKGVPDSALLDLIKTTLAREPFEGQYQTTLTNQRWVALNKWFAEDKVQLAGGERISHRIQLNPQGNSRHLLPYERVPINVIDHMSTITAPWVRAHTRWTIDSAEMMRNRGPSRLIDLFQSRRKGAAVDYAKFLEKAAWNAPVNASDARHPYGLAYWLSKVNANVDTTGDFIGQTVRYQDGSTSTVKGGIDAVPNDHWQNWAFTYDSINEDFLLRMTEAFYASDFR